MNVIIKTNDDISKIKKAVSIWKKVKNELITNCKPGITLLELDQIARDNIIKLGGQPTFYKKYGFPGNICISVNDCVIHGVPNEYSLKSGDLVKFDVGVTYDSHVCDAAFSVIVDNNNFSALQIKNVCDLSLKEVEKIIKPGITNMDIARFLEDFITKNGYFILEDFTGHGCGNELHEDPAFPNYYSPYFDVVELKENMVFCLEPMILTNSKKYYIDAKNGWNVIASNHKLTCHTEDMFLVTKDGCVVLTQD